MQKYFLPALALLALAACKKDDPAVPAKQLSGTLSGAQAIPAVASSGTGSVTGTYDPNTMVLTYSVTYAGITPTAGHFHYGDPRHTNPNRIMLLFNNVGTSPITGTATLTPMQADSLLAGRIYANLHTQANPAGELRANVTAK